MKRTAGGVTASAIFLTAILGLWPTPAPAQEGEGEGQWPPPEELVWFARSLSGEDAAIQEARAALLDHIQETYLASPGDTRKISLRTWNDLTGVLADDMALTVRGQWVSALRSAYVEDAGTLTAMDLSAAERLSTALSRLDDQRAREVVPAWMTQSASWQELEPGGLVALARRLQWCREAGAPARAELGGFLTSRYVTDAESLRTIPLEDVLRLANLLALDLPPEARTQWVTGLHTSVLQHGEAGGTLGTYTTTWLKDALTAMGEEHPTQTVLAWVQAAEWAAMGPDGLARLAHHLAQMGEAGKEGRLEMAEHLQTCYLVDAESVRQLSPQHWDWLTGHLAEDLSDEARASWAQGLLEAYVDNAETLKDLAIGEVRDLQTALGRLGVAAASSRLAPRWMAVVAWQDLEPGGLADLANGLREAGESGRAGRRALAEHVEQRYLGDAALVRQVSPKHWDWLTDHLTEDLSAENRSAWVTGLWMAYVTDASAFSQMNLWAVKHLESALYRLGHPRALLLVSVWAERTKAWQSLGPKGLVSLAWNARRAGAAGNTVRQHLVKRIEGQYLASPEEARAIGIRLWESLVNALVDSLSPESRQLWLDRLRTYYAGDNQTIADMKRDKAAAVAQCLAPLDQEVAAQIAVVWLRAHDLLQVKESQKLSSLARLAVSIPEGKDLLVTLDEAWIAADAEERFGLNTIWDIMRTWATAGEPDKVREWVTRAYNVRLGTEEARSSAKIGMLTRLADLMVMGGLTGKGKGYAAFASSLARCARERGLQSANFKFLGYPLGTPESRERLRQELVDVDGMPRLGVAKTLAWAHRHVDEMKRWCGYLEEKVGQSSGDAKALWLAAKGYAATLLPKRPIPLRSRQWLNQALAAAESERARLAILKEFAGFYRAIGQPGDGVEMLESLKQQFGAEALAEVEKFQCGLRRQEARQVAAAARSEVAGRIAEDEWLLAWGEEGGTEGTTP